MVCQGVSAQKESQDPTRKNWIWAFKHCVTRENMAWEMEPGDATASFGYRQRSCLGCCSCSSAAICSGNGSRGAVRSDIGRTTRTIAAM
jgi:hypothetical protein